MLEIIPNWHPIFVHFTIALFSFSVFFYLLFRVAMYLNFSRQDIIGEFEIVARWSLLSAALMSIATVLAGWYAYNTVKHDEISHVAMVIHRNWAIPTMLGIVMAALYSEWAYYKNKRPNSFFFIMLIVIQFSLLSTAWHGAELVFRYGLGVISLPKEEGTMHHHHTE